MKLKTLLAMAGILVCTRLLAQDATNSTANAPAPAAASHGPRDTHGLNMSTQQGKPPAPAGAPGGGKYFPPAPANHNLPTLWLIGDSTVRNGSAGDGSNMNQWGWGAPLTFYFDPNKINVVNFAYGGTSSRSYYTGFWWTYLLKEVKPGDFIILQFGANDNGKASLSGTGDNTQPGQNGQTLHSFGWYLKQYVKEGRAKGATVMIASLTPRKQWSNDGHLKRDTSHAVWSEDVAKETGAPFIALNELIARKYDSLGQDAVVSLYCPAPKEGLHTGWDGAVVNAECVVAGLKALKDDPLAPYFSAKADAVAAVDVSTPEGPVKAPAAANGTNAKSANSAAGN